MLDVNASLALLMLGFAAYSNIFIIFISGIIFNTRSCSPD